MIQPLNQATGGFCLLLFVSKIWRHDHKEALEAKKYYNLIILNALLHKIKTVDFFWASQMSCRVIFWIFLASLRQECWIQQSCCIINSHRRNVHNVAFNQTHTYQREREKALFYRSKSISMPLLYSLCMHKTSNSLDSLSLSIYLVLILT